MPAARPRLVAEGRPLTTTPDAGRPDGSGASSPEKRTSSSWEGGGRSSLSAALRGQAHRGRGNPSSCTSASVKTWIVIGGDEKDDEKDEGCNNGMRSGEGGGGGRSFAAGTSSSSSDDRAAAMEVESLTPPAPARRPRALPAHFVIGGGEDGGIRDGGTRTAKSKQTTSICTMLVIGGEDEEEMRLDSAPSPMRRAWRSAPPPPPPPPPMMDGDVLMDGDDEDDPEHTRSPPKHVAAEAPQRMLVDDITPLPPLVVIDGANVAYAYGDARGGGGARAPDARGIHVAARRLLAAGCRVQVVLPAPWLRARPRAGDPDRSDASMVTPALEGLRGLRARGLLCAAPPADDDDAYALALARREDARAARRQGGRRTGPAAGNGGGGGGGARRLLEDGGGFVLSNDFFRDATRRDAAAGGRAGLRAWLEGGTGTPAAAATSLAAATGVAAPPPAGRISYSFADLGSIDEYGDFVLDFVPNPRHPLVVEVEAALRERERAMACPNS